MTGLQLTATVAERGFDLDLSLGAGERLAVLGPNGAGKSTLLGLLAGTLRPDAGHADLAGRTLFDSAAGAWLRPHSRGVALLAQDPLLFPHLSVLENVAFGPRVGGAGRAEANRRAERWLTEVDAAEFASRRATELSGGQAQRVAIARALATEPELLLLDEPLAALDVGVAPAIRRVLRRVLAGRTTVIVTHDLLDALLLSDRIVVVEQGRVVESGATQDVLDRPRTRFTARLAGLNLVRGVAEGEAVRQGSGELITGTPAEPLTAGAPVAAVFAPDAVAVFTEPPHGSPRNQLPVQVTEVEPRGGRVRVRARGASGQGLAAEVTAGAVSELDLYPGRDVSYVVKATAVTIYPT